MSKMILTCKVTSTCKPTARCLRRLLCLGALAAFSAGESHAQQGPAADLVTATMPIYGQILRFAAPGTYKPAFSKDNGGKFFIFEMIPKGETLEKWSGMITLTGSSGSAAKLPPMRDYIGNFYNLYRKACPQTFSAKPVGQAQLNGHVAIAVYFSCGRLMKPAYGPQGHSESVVIAFIEGAKDLYTVQWAERATPQDTPIPFEVAKWQSRLDVLRKVRLCDRREGEREPYPSCLAVK